MDEKLSSKFRWFSLSMTLAIVCYHVAPHFLSLLSKEEVYSNVWWHKYLKNFYETFGQYALCFFFATSAYFFIRGKDSIPQRIKKRCKTLLVPFFIWNTVYLMFFCLVDRKMIIGGGIRRIILGFTVCNNNGNTLSFLFLYSL